MRMMFNPRYGLVGMMAMPYFMIFEFLSPLFSLVGIIVTIVLFRSVSCPFRTSWRSCSCRWVSASSSRRLRWRSRRSQITGTGAVANIWRLVLYAVLENVGFHQLHDIWRTIGYVDIAKGTTSWGAQQRRGFEAATQAELPTQ